MPPAKGLSLVIETLYLAFFISLACSFRAISSISIGLLIITGLFISWRGYKSIFSQILKNPFFYGCLLLYFFYFLSVLFSNNKQESWFDMQVKSGLIFTPLAVCCTGFVDSTTRKRLYFYFIITVAAVSSYCLGRAIGNYSQSGNSSFFFYHLLVRPVKGHAIYFSVPVFIALVSLTEAFLKNNFLLNKLLHAAIIIFLSVFLFLLSSKLVIGFYFLYLIVQLIRVLKNKTSSRLLIIGTLALFTTGTILILATSNPVSKRFTDIINGDLKVVNMEKYNPGMYFNGIQFRLLQWKFTNQILNENHAWWTGLGPGNAQHLLDQKYISTNMYIGEPARGDKGFLGYNTHNQFLETLLRTGIFGLIALLFTCFTLIKMAWRIRKREISFIIGFFLIWFFTESVLESQYGIIIFTFFPLFLLTDEK